MDDLIEGRIVHYVLPDGGHRPAVIVRVWSKETGCANMLVFTDGTNDAGFNRGVDVYWATSVRRSDAKEPGTWHWPERAEAP